MLEVKLKYDGNGGGDGGSYSQAYCVRWRALGVQLFTERGGGGGQGMGYGRVGSALL